MKNTILSLIIAVLLFPILIACSNKQNDSKTAATLSTANRGLDATDKESVEFLLVRRWENLETNTYLDLKIDGSFEGVLEKEELVFGVWGISENQETLRLSGDQGQEGKGKVFKALYSVLEMSFEKIRIKNEAGVEVTFTASE